jgi:hypothetical protein
MIVADIFSNLGNQLFIYAATKSIALDLGYEYRYRVVRPGFAREDSCIDDYGQEYIKDFEQAFHIDTTERIDDLPTSIQNKWEWNRTPSTNYIKDVYDISDNTHLCGYFLCPKYFEHRRAEVLKWFRFQDEYLERCQKKREKIIKSTGATHLVSIHVRCGKFYRQLGMVIDPGYHRNAIRLIRKKFEGEKLCFILFSDVPDEAKKMLKNEGKDIVLHHGTMFEDLCLMTLCDSHIIANSTFSWWGAWLSESTKGIVIRPSVWRIGPKKLGPEDIFPSSWISVDSKRASLSISDRWNRANYIFSSNLGLKIKQILRLVKALLKKLLPDLLFKKGA